MLGKRPVLCAVLDAEALGGDPHERACDLFQAGVDWIQLRDRNLEGEALWRLACALVAARDEAEPDGPRHPSRRVIVNKRTDLACAVEADGAHLGFDALGPAPSRRLLGQDALLGASLHSVEEVAAASAGALDYAHLAPIWDPISKPATRPALGLDRLAEAARSGLPLLAQGGVDPDRAAEALRAGAAGVAVTGILASAASTRTLREAVSPLRERLDQAARQALV